MSKQEQTVDHQNEANAQISACERVLLSVTSVMMRPVLMVSCFASIVSIPQIPLLLASLAMCLDVSAKDLDERLTPGLDYTMQPQSDHKQKRLKKPKAWPFYADSDQARETGEFMSAVRPNPMQFIWEGHKVEVCDCWQQRSVVGDLGQFFYLFVKLKIDGSSTAESQIANDSGLHLIFQNESDDGLRNKRHQPGSYKVRRHNAVELVHALQLEGSNREQVKLRVGTLREYKFPSKYLKKHPREDPNYKKSLQPSLSDSILIFDLAHKQ